MDDRTRGEVGREWELKRGCRKQIKHVELHGGTRPVGGEEGKLTEGGIDQDNGWGCHLKKKHGNPKKYPRNTREIGGKRA